MGHLRLQRPVMTREREKGFRKDLILVLYPK
jgi:hypothetical protein